MITYVTAALLAICLTLWIRWRRKRFSFWKNLGVPGPKPGFWFGNAIEYYKKNPAKAQLEWVQKYGKVLGYYLGARPVLLVTDPEMVKFIQVKNFQKFTNRSTMFELRDAHPDPQDRSVVSQLGEKWKRIRSILSPSFTTTKMKLMHPLMQSATEDLLSIVTGKEEVEIYKLYKGLTMDVIGRAAFGIQTQVQKDPDNDVFLKYSLAVFRRVPFFFELYVVAVSFPELDPLWKNLWKIYKRLNNLGRFPRDALTKECGNIIRARKMDPKNRRPDLLQLMLDTEMTEEQMQTTTLTAGEDEDVTENPSKYQNPVANGHPIDVKRLTEEEMKFNVGTFFLAGYETTSTALAFITYFLVKYQEVQEKVRKEIQDIVESNGQVDYESLDKLKYLDAACKEAIRFYPPIYMFVTRQASEDIKYGSMVIPRGTSIHIPSYTIQHDADFWPEPETFDPDRFLPENKHLVDPFAFQTFGGGPRNCIGIRFARMEIKTAIASLLLQYRLLPGSRFEKELEIMYDINIMRPKNGIHVRLEPIS